MDTSNRRIVIFGKTGSGKSSLANTVFGERLFKTGHTANSGTRKCKAKTKSVNGRSITLIDTPGLFDTNRPEEELKREIVRCITECAPGPHAFLIVFKVERFTKQEQDVVKKINQYFSEEVFKYATVVFTHGDQLRKRQTIDDFVRQNKLLSDLVKKCGGRCHVIDNKYWKKKPKHEYRSNQFQVEELFKTIDKMVMENNGNCYTNKMLQAVKKEIEQEEENIRQSSRDMLDQEIREQARVNVSTRLSVRLVGITAGVLVGALCGVVVSVGIVFVAISGVEVKAVKTAAEAVKAVSGAAAVVETAAGGGAAGGGAATAEGKTAAVVVGISAAVGAVYGGVRGYHACEGVDTEWEAAKNAAEAVMNDAECFFDKAKDFSKKTF